MHTPNHLRTAIFLMALLLLATGCSEEIFLDVITARTGTLWLMGLVLFFATIFWSINGHAKKQRKILLEIRDHLRKEDGNP